MWVSVESRSICQQISLVLTDGDSCEAFRSFPSQVFLASNSVTTLLTNMAEPYHAS